MKNWSIRTRVLFLALAPSVMILLALITYFTYTSIAEVDISLERHGISVARQLASDVGIAQRLNKIARFQVRERGVVEADFHQVALQPAIRFARADAAESDARAIARSG